MVPRPQFVLRVSDTNYVTVKMYTTGPALCAEDLQGVHNSPPTVSMMTRPGVGGRGKQVALICQDGEDHYSPKVVGSKLELEKKDLNDSTDSFSDDHWFEKVKQTSGKQYLLRTVVKPAKYLAVDDIRFIVTDDKQNSALITEE